MIAEAAMPSELLARLTKAAKGIQGVLKLSEFSLSWQDLPEAGTASLQDAIARFARHFHLSVAQRVPVDEVGGEWGDALLESMNSEGGDTAREGDGGSLAKGSQPESHLARAWAVRPKWVPADADQQRLMAALLDLACAPLPSTPLPTPTSPVLVPGGPAAQVLLQAGRPTTVLVRAPADLRYQRAVLRLTGCTLLRDLAQVEDKGLRWGGERSGSDMDCSVTLRQPMRITSVMLTDDQLAAFIKEDREYVGTRRLWRAVLAACLLYGHRRCGVVVTIGQPGATTTLADIDTASLNQPLPLSVDSNAITLSATAHGAGSLPSWHVFSPSASRAVAVGVGDDTPQQVLGAEIADGVSVATRDLAAAFQAAWGRAKPVDGVVTIPLSLLSVQDGLVQVALEGAWDRYTPLPAGPVTLVPHQTHALALPSLAGAPGARISLRSRGTAAGGVVQALVPASAAIRCAVLVDERLHIAQALRLRDPSATPGTATTLAAVWVCLESLPTAAAQLRLTLAPSADGSFGSGRDIGSCAVTLPVDQSAYQQRAGETCWWFRVPWQPGLPLDGVQAGQPLVLMASGDATGLRLMHAQVAAAPPVPLGRGAGRAHFRHLDRDRSWRPRELLGSAVQWQMDVELAPLDDEAVVTADGTTLHQGGGRWPEATWNGTNTSDSLALVSTVAGALEISGEVVAPYG